MSEPIDDFDRDALALRDRIREASDLLREHCDSVVILATLSIGDSSTMIYQSRGNIYAVDGSIARYTEMRCNERDLFDGRDQESES